MGARAAAGDRGHVRDGPATPALRSRWSRGVVEELIWELGNTACWRILGTGCCVADRPGGAGLDFEGTEGLQEAIATIDAIALNATGFCRTALLC